MADLFAGTFAGSVPEPTCIKQLWVATPLNGRHQIVGRKAEKPLSRSVRGGFGTKVRTWAAEPLDVEILRSRLIGEMPPITNDGRHQRLGPVAELTIQLLF